VRWPCVSVATDTDSDKGYISDLQFKPLTLTPVMREQDATAERIVVDVPANFPIPAVTHVEKQQFSDRITITGIMGMTPDLATSTMDKLLPLNNFAPWFVMNNTISLALPSFFVQGTYEANGPTESRSVPFSVEFQPVDGLTQLQRAGIKGGLGFDNGFEFALVRNMIVEYQAVNPVIFDDQVDGVQFQASFASEPLSVRLLNGMHFPEPGSLTLLVAAGLVLAGTARRRIA